jgi:uncharacterized protein YeaO (DUF488 family)
MTVKIKRIYEVPDVEDGMRILVDRLWPRGVKKENARIDLWLKDIGPSSDLRKWFGHDPKRWPQFRAKYIQELGFKKRDLSVIIRAATEGPVTLVYAATDESRNQAVILQEIVSRA